jgi:hypothetical protein
MTMHFYPPEEAKEIFNSALAATGGVNYAVAQDELPEGWVSITWWPKPYTDMYLNYSGPVTAETVLDITITVFGERMQPWLKTRCDIVRSLR